MEEVEVNKLVELENIDALIEELHYRLMYLKVDEKGLRKVLQAPPEGTERTLGYVQAAFGDVPFKVSDPDRAKELARFLVEDRSEKELQYDPEVTADYETLLAKCVKLFRLNDFDSTADLSNDVKFIGAYVHNHRTIIDKQFESLKDSQTSTITREHLDEAIQFSQMEDEQLSLVHIELIIMYLFNNSSTGNIDQLEYKKLYELFPQN